MSEKSWERPWSTQEMIENSSNWSLAGDSGLLKYLEEFSNKLLSKAKETTDKIDNLADSINEASLSLLNVQNEFMGLHNTQFIESRVYEDDETLPTSVSSEKETKPKPTEAEKLEEMKQAILNGLEIVDKYYERVEIPASDSEDDADEPSVIYQPVDQYADRPLPYVIGTDVWHKYWHVGLLESSSDEEMDNQEEFSDSEAENEIPNNQPVQKQYGVEEDSESELDIDTKVPKRNPEEIIFDSSGSETGSAQVQIPPNNFAAELSAKLGKVEAGNIENEQINKNPIRPPSFGGGLFSDEPPPLDEQDIKPISTGLFSGGQGLFDSDPEDENDFWAPNTVKTTPKPPEVKEIKKKSDTIIPDENIFKEEEDNIFGKQEVVEKPKKKITSLFDDDDDLFSTKTQGTSSKTDLFNDEPPEIEKLESPKKKLPGIISPFGNNSSLLNEIKQVTEKKHSPEKTIKISENKDPLFTENISEKTEKNTKTEYITKPENVTKPKKVENIFEDDSPLFTDDIFSSKYTNLFDSDKKRDKKPPKSLFSDEPPELSPKNLPSSSKNKNLFDSPEDDLFIAKESSNLFGDKEKDPLSTKLFSTEKSEKNLFDDTNQKSLFDDDIFEKKTNLFDDFQSKTPQNINEFDKNTNLFKQNDDITNLFGKNSENTNLFTDESDNVSKEHKNLLKNSDSDLFVEQKNQKDSVENDLFNTKEKSSTNLFKPEKTVEFNPLFSKETKLKTSTDLFDQKYENNIKPNTVSDKKQKNYSKEVKSTQNISSELFTKDIAEKVDKNQLIGVENNKSLSENLDKTVILESNVKRSPEILGKVNLDVAKEIKSDKTLGNTTLEGSIGKSTQKSSENLPDSNLVHNAKSPEIQSVEKKLGNTALEGSNVAKSTQKSSENLPDSNLEHNAAKSPEIESDKKEKLGNTALEGSSVAKSTQKSENLLDSNLLYNVAKSPEIQSVKKEKLGNTALEGSSVARSTQKLPENLPDSNLVYSVAKIQSVEKKLDTALDANVAIYPENSASVAESCDLRSSVAKSSEVIPENCDNALEGVAKSIGDKLNSKNVENKHGSTDLDTSNVAKSPKKKSIFTDKHENFSKSVGNTDLDTSSIAKIPEKSILDNLEKDFSITAKNSSLVEDKFGNTANLDTSVAKSIFTDKHEILEENFLGTSEKKWASGDIFGKTDLENSSGSKSLLKDLNTNTSGVQETSGIKNKNLVADISKNVDILFSEPPPLDDQKSDQSSDFDDVFTNKIESDVFKSKQLNEDREDLFSENYTKSSYSGLFDWVPPEIEPNVKETKKSISSLFSDEEDLFDNKIEKTSLWDKEPPPLEKKTEIFEKSKTDLIQKDFVKTQDISRDNFEKSTKKIDKGIFSDDEDLFKPKFENTDPLGGKIFDSSLENSKNKLKINKNLKEKSDSLVTEKEIEKTSIFSDAKSENLFSDEEDLFKKPDILKKDDRKVDKSKKSNIFSEERKSKTEKPKNTNIFSEDSDDDLFSNKNNLKEVKKPDILNSGKIKHNLNINVAALLPGAAPKKSKISPDKSPEISPERQDSEKKEVFLDSPIENLDILSSAAKQRVRIPVKRRPSTRRARQEAIRKSGMEFNFEEDIPETKTVKNSPSEEEKNIQNVENNNPTDLFQDTSSEKSKSEDSVFKKTKKSQKLFDDDDDDDLFDNIVSKPVSKGPVSSTSSKKSTSRIKKLTGHSTDISDPLDVFNK